MAKALAFITHRMTRLDPITHRRHQPPRRAAVVRRPVTTSSSLLALVVLLGATAAVSSFTASAPTYYYCARIESIRRRQSRHPGQALKAKRGDNENDNVPSLTPPAASSNQKQTKTRPPVFNFRRDDDDNLSSSERRRAQKRAMVAKRRQGEQASASMDLPSPTEILGGLSPENNNEVMGLPRTLRGGTALLFEMARRQGTAAAAAAAAAAPERPNPPPRWHSSSRDLSSSSPAKNTNTAFFQTRNPNFRTRPPRMDQQEYAATIWRNVRKRSKPSMWRYALRTYHSMNGGSSSGTNNNKSNSNSRVLVERTVVHYEGALLACAKLGLWDQAVQIYEEVLQRCSQQQQQKGLKKNARTRSSAGVVLQVTDNMIMSLIRASVRAARQKRAQIDDDDETNNNDNINPRRASLDACLALILDMPERHGIPLTAQHLNPLAAAYQSIGCDTASQDLLYTHLTNRTGGPEEEDGTNPLNVHDISARNKGSYALLVQAAVSAGDWAGAVVALRDMTDGAGLYPARRHLNTWTEVSERKTKQRTTRSWKKKREEYLLDSVVRTTTTTTTTTTREAAPRGSTN